MGSTNQLIGSDYFPKGQAVSESLNTVTSIDVGQDLYSRANVTNLPTSPAITRPETIFSNQVNGSARVGYRWRRPDTGVLNSVNQSVNVPETISLSLIGTGMGFVVLPGTNGAAAGSMVMSITKP